MGRPGENPGPSKDGNKTTGDGFTVVESKKAKRSKKQLAKSTSTRRQRAGPRPAARQSRNQRAAQRPAARSRKEFTAEETAAYRKRVKRRSDEKLFLQQAQAFDALYCEGTTVKAVWPPERKPGKFYPARILAIQGPSYEQAGAPHLREALVEYLGRHRNTQPCWVLLYWRSKKGGERQFDLQPSAQQDTPSTRSELDIARLCDQRETHWMHQRDVVQLTRERKQAPQTFDFEAQLLKQRKKKAAIAAKKSPQEPEEPAPSAPHFSTGNGFGALSGVTEEVPQVRRTKAKKPRRARRKVVSATPATPAASPEAYPELGAPVVAAPVVAAPKTAPVAVRPRKTRRGKRGGKKHARQQPVPGLRVPAPSAAPSEASVATSDRVLPPACSPAPLAAAPPSAPSSEPTAASETTTRASSATSQASSVEVQALMEASARREADLRSEMRQMREDHAKQMQDMMAQMLEQQRVQQQKQMELQQQAQQKMMLAMMSAFGAASSA